MDRTTVSRAIRPLLRDGLIVVQPGSDARTRLIALTFAGKALLKRMTPAWERAQAEFEARFGADETKDLRKKLTQVVVQMV